MRTFEFHYKPGVLVVECGPENKNIETFDQILTGQSQLLSELSTLRKQLDVAREALMGGSEKGGVFWREVTLTRIDEIGKADP